jgi:hypothetical protein
LLVLLKGLLLRKLRKVFNTIFKKSVIFMNSIEPWFEFETNIDFF